MAARRWLFVANLPSSGSTAFAALLATAPAVGAIERRGEGQWLVPELSAPGRRWDPDLDIDLDAVRAAWLGAADALPADVSVVIEKSPPNLCRMARLLAAFDEAPVRLVRLARDPMAITASWARRYGPETIVREWTPELAGKLTDEAAYFRALGALCGRRFAMLRDLERLADLTLRYEDIAADAPAAVGKLAALYPELGAIRTAFEAGAGFADRNAGLRATLSPAQREWVREGLAPNAGAVRAFGYDPF